MWRDEGDLRFWDPVAAGWPLNIEEEHDGRLEAESRAYIAEAQAEEEQSARIAAETRIAELEAEILRLRGE